MTDTNNCKHYYSDKKNCKKFKTSETDHIDKINNYWKCYFNNKTDSAVQTVKIW